MLTRWMIDSFPVAAYNPSIETSRDGIPMKVNHHSLAYKMQAKPNKTYKARIAEWMFRSVCEYYKEHGEMPREEAAEQITNRIYDKIKSLAIWVPYDEVHRAFLTKLPRYESRIIENGIPEEKPPKKKAAPAPKKKGNSNKVCPNCGRKMKQQFIGLQHCKCGMSWKKGDGFFERSNDMVFALQRRKVGKKIKQCPVIRYKDDQ